MNGAKILLVLSVLMMAMVLLDGVGFSAQPTARTGASATQPAGSAATQPAAKPRIAVVDFEVIGDVGIKDAGPAVAELLLASFGKDRYQPVERSQLAAILKEVDLTIAQIVENPDLLKGKKVSGVKYLVMGSVVKFGDLAVTARVVDVVSGEWGEWGKESAADAQGIGNALGALATKLEGGKVIGTPVSPKKELVLDLGGKVSMKLVLIPAGKFLMGSPAGEKDRSDNEGPQHEVTISKAFYMGVCTVTQAQWKAVMGTTIAQQRDKARKDLLLYGEGDDHPMYYISWDEAVEFCKRLSQKTGKTVSLPTEAQWEYSCRAGSKTRFSFGDDEGKLGDYAWYAKNSDNKTHPVGQKKPNDWGLYDMHGSVWQWCSDWSEPYANASKTDPAGPASGSYRVLRGGCWYNDPKYCRSAYRPGLAPDSRDDYVGFRVVVDLK